MKSNNKYVWTSMLTALGASLCCITPVLALISGASGLASVFAWIEPLRPYLIGITILVLSFAWFQKIKPQKEIECNCEIDEKTNFLQTKLFLTIVTIFAIIMLVFPYYSNVFFLITQKQNFLKTSQILQKLNL